MARSLIFATVLIISIMISAPEARALPRYSATYGQDCGLCHQDPTGGGLRTLYASQYLIPTELAARAPESEMITPLIADRILLGVDLRTLFTDAEDLDARQIQMQSELHVAFLADESMSIQLDLGQGGAQEAFGLAYVLPTHGWIKAGRFTPNYGWKNADHQIFARRYVLNSNGSRSPAEWESVGIEAGLSPGPLQLTGSIDEGGALGESWTSSGVFRFSPGPVNLAVGASLMRREHFNGHRRSAGVHAAAQAGPASWLVQWDEPREDDREERIISQELVVVIARGVNLRAVHGFFDSASGERQRFGAGVDYLATPFMGALAMINHDEDDRAGGLIFREGWSADLVLHFLY